MMTPSAHHDEDPAVLALLKMIEETGSGVRGAQLRRVALPSQATKIIEVLKTGDTDAISYLMRDVSGEAVSLSAGQTMSGAAAVEAISNAQAACLVQTRRQANLFDQAHSDMVAAQNLLLAHQLTLIEWVRYGTISSDLPDSPSDLTLIGREFLVTPDLRLSSIGVFAAATEVMRCGLEMFSV